MLVRPLSASHCKLLAGIYFSRDANAWLKECAGKYKQIPPACVSFQGLNFDGSLSVPEGAATHVLESVQVHAHSGNLKH